MTKQKSLDGSPKNVLVVGGGGIGAITALNLDAGGMAKVSMVLRSNYGVVEQNGYHINSVDHGLMVGWRPYKVFLKVPSISECNSDPFHYVVCTVKSILDSQPSALEIIRPAITPSITSIVLIQNGLNIEIPFISAFPANVVLSGISYMGSRELAHGVIQQDYPDKLEVGIFNNEKLSHAVQVDTAADFIQRYRAGGKTNVSFVSDVSGSRWTKLLYNASINPLSAILQMNAGSLQLSGALDKIALPAIEEIRAVAAARGTLIEENSVKSVIDMANTDKEFHPSMCVDVMKNNLIEYESLIGEPIRVARTFNIPTPVLDILYELCHAIQWRIRQRKGSPIQTIA